MKPPADPLRPRHARTRVAAITDGVPAGAAASDRSRRERLLMAIGAVVAVLVAGGALGLGLDNATIGPPTASSSPGPVAPASVNPGPAVVRTAPPSGPTDAGLVDPAHGWAVVNGRLLMTSDGGATWADRMPPVRAMAGDNPLGVSFLDPLHGWVAINESFTSPADPLYGRVDVWRTHDGGRSWAKVELSKAAINHVGEVMPRVQFDFLDSTRGFAVISGVSAGGPGDSDLYWTADGGATWSPDRPTGAGRSGLSGLVGFANPDDGVMAGTMTGSGLFVTHDAGASWRNVPLTPPAGFGGAQAFFGQPRFFGAVGAVPVLYQTGSGQHAIRVFTTSDAGATWAIASTLPANGVTRIVDATDWVVVPWTSSDVLHSADGGATWTPTPTMTRMTLVTPTVWFTTAMVGWAIAGQPGGTTLMATNDGGATWHALAPVPSTSEPVAPAMPPASVSPSAGSATIGGFRWRRVDGEFGGAQPGPMTAVGSGLVMATSPFGVVTPNGAWPHPTFWRSSDGSSWRRLPDSLAFAGVSMRWIDTVGELAPRGRGLIAVGAQLSADSSTANAEAWTSPDGRTWTRATVPGARGATMGFAYPVPGGFVAIGTDGYSFHAGMERGTAIWTSTDGSRWSRLPQTAVPAGVGIRSVARGDGRYVAVGEALPPGASPSRPTVPIWVSSDGVHYRMLAASVGAPPADAMVSSVIWTGSAFVAVGTEETVGSYAWRSSDGITWQQVELPPSGPAGALVHVDGLGQARTGLVATGWISDRSGAAAGTVWELSDGQAWRRVTTSADFPNVGLDSVSALGDRVFVDGEDMVQGGTLLWVLDPGPAGR